MGEIDDVYKNEAETIDQDFLEQLKNGGDHDKIFENYRKEILRSRTRFEKNYSKFNESEKKRLAKIKKKLPKNEKVKSLVVEHFDFEFGFWERTWMRLDVFWFGLVRSFSRFWADLSPAWFVYRIDKVWNFFKYALRDFKEWRGMKIENIKSWFVKFGLGIWKIVKSFFLWYKKIGGKAMFWRKKVEENKKEEGEEAPENKGEEGDKEKGSA